MSSAGLRNAAKDLVKSLERFPDERFKHLISFKETQLQRYREVAGLKNVESGKDNKATLSEIKDMINRTSGPLGLKKEILEKIQSSVPEDKYTESSVIEQMKALETLRSNKYKMYYEVGDKLYKPAGNPQYYARIMDELTNKKKENLMTAFRTVVFGK